MTERPSCGWCGARFSPRKGSAGKFCSQSCAANGNRGHSAVVRHRQVRRPGHPIAPSSGIVAVSRIVLYEKIGPGDHACHWCGKRVRWNPGGGLKPGSLIADHLDFDATNDSTDNIVPTCNMCNRHRLATGRRAPIQDGELFLTNSNGDKTRATERKCKVCGETFVAAMSQAKIGRALYCSRSCARRGPRRKRVTAPG